MMEQGYSLADIAAATGNSGGNNNDGFGGNNGAWWIIILLLALGRGFGYGNGNGNGGGGSQGGYQGGSYGVCATPADVRSAVDQQTLISKIDQQTYGLADTFTALNASLNSNFRGIDNAICTLGYNQAQLANGISSQIAQCCCDVRAGIADVNYNNAINTNTLDRSIYTTGNSLSRQLADCCCDIEKMNMQTRFDMQAYNCNTLNAIDKVGDRVIDYLANADRERLRDENFALRLAASQERQNNFLIDALGQKCPQPAYVVQPPQNVTFPTNCCGQVQYAGNNCGCGCGGY